MYIHITYILIMNNNATNNTTTATKNDTNTYNNNNDTNMGPERLLADKLASSSHIILHDSLFLPGAAPREYK